MTPKNPMEFTTPVEKKYRVRVRDTWYPSDESVDSIIKELEEFRGRAPYDAHVIEEYGYENDTHLVLIGYREPLTLLEFEARKNEVGSEEIIRKAALRSQEDAEKTRYLILKNKYEGKD